VLYEFLTGSVPFRGKDPASTLAKILHDSPASLSNLAGSYSADLDAVVRRALSKDRNTRYTSMEDLGFDLRSLEEKLSRELIETSLHSAESFMGSGQWEKAREQ
jgi:serine/threonine protein kinase